MREHELSDWRGALATARLVPNTGMVPLKSSTLLAVEARIEELKEAVRSARADEAHCWASRVDTLTAQLREVDARYMALLKAVADGVAMQPRTVVLDLGPNTTITGATTASGGLGVGVVAFPGGSGTADMTAKAEAAGIRVWRPRG